MAKDRDKDTIKDIAEELKMKNILAELTDEEKQQLELEAANEVAKELKDTKRKEFKLAAKQRLKKKALFSEGKDQEGSTTEYVLIQLANHADEIRLDGRRYIHGKGYWLNQATASVVKDIMFRTALNYAHTHGEREADFYGKRPSTSVGTNVAISPNRPLPAGVHA